MSNSVAAAVAPDSRIPSIDQFRGYAILGMLVVDYFGVFDATWNQLRHHREIYTFADTIAPIFLFVVGMGMRLSMIRRIEKVGVRQARWDLFKRYWFLLLLAFFFYTGYLWDALTNIALAGMVALLVVDKKPLVRIAYALAFLALYQAVFSWTVYGDWLLRTVKFDDDSAPLIFKLIPFGPTLLQVPINGGPLGHWSWLLMLIGGTIGYDLIATRNTRKIVIACVGLGAACLAIGYALHVEWPGMKAFWPFSKYYMTAPVSFWSTGWCFLIMLAFHLLCDRANIRIPHLSVLGMNPLFIYLLHWCILESAHRFLPGESTNWLGIVAGWFLFYGICYGTAYYLYKRNIIIKL